jgi:hypothetical protein
MKDWHFLFYAGLVVCVIVLFSTGMVPFIVAVACALVGGMMIWMMVWPDRHRDGGTPREDAGGHRRSVRGGRVSNR